MFIKGKYKPPFDFFSKYCPFEVHRHTGIGETENFFLRILQSFCVFGEYAERI
jgi:hypothetical protein